MAPRAKNKNFAYLKSIVDCLYSPQAAFNEAMNSIAPGTGEAFSNLAENTVQLTLNVPDDFESRLMDPYQSSAVIKPGIRLSNAADENATLRAEEELRQRFAYIGRNSRMKEYPNIKEYASFTADFLGMSSKGIDTQREWSRCPGMPYFTDGAVDWTNRNSSGQTIPVTANSFERMLSGMHFKEYFDNARLYMKTKQALDSPDISYEEKMKKTTLLRRSLKNIEQWVDHCMLDETAEKVSKYHVNYDLNTRGDRGIDIVKMDCQSQLEALDLGWDPTYIEDYAQIKELTDRAGKSLDAFDQLNSSILTDLKEKVSVLSELSPKGKQFFTPAEFSQYYQQVGNAIKDVYDEVNRPEVKEELLRLDKSGAFKQEYAGHEGETLEMNMPAKLIPGKGDGEVYGKLKFFSSRPVPVNYVVPQVQADPLLAPYEDRLKKAWSMSPKEKEALKKEILDSLKIPEDDYYPEYNNNPDDSLEDYLNISKDDNKVKREDDSFIDLMEEEDPLADKKRAISKAIKGGWELEHLIELPMLMKISEENAKGLEFLDDALDVPDELGRLRSLMEELKNQDPVKHMKNQTEDGFLSKGARKFENPDQFSEYCARTRGILRDMRFEVSKPEVKRALSGIMHFTSEEKLFKSTILYTLMAPKTNQNAEKMTSVIDMLDPEKDRFKGKPGVMDTVRKVALAREREAISRIGDEALKELNDLSFNYDNQREYNSNLYLDMKNSLARTVGLGNGDHTPGMVYSCLKNLYKAADKYENSKQGWKKSEVGSQRLAKAAHLKKFCEKALREYEQATEGQLSTMTTVEKQKKTLALKKNEVYDKNAANTAECIADFKEISQDLFSKLENDTAFFARDLGNRGGHGKHDSYDRLAENMTKISQMQSDLDSQNPNKIFTELNNAMRSAKRYVDEHTGITNIFRATHGDGARRLQSARRIYDLLRNELMQLSVPHEGLICEGSNATIRELTQNYAPAPAAAPEMENNVIINNNINIDNNAVININDISGNDINAQGGDDIIGEKLDDMDELGINRDGINPEIVEAVIDDQDIEKIEFTNGGVNGDKDLFDNEEDKFGDLFDAPSAGVPENKKIDYKKEMEKYHEMKGDLKKDAVQMQAAK